MDGNREPGIENRESEHASDSRFSIPVSRFPVLVCRLPILLLLVLAQLFIWPQAAPAQVASQPPSAEEALRQDFVPWRDLQDLVMRVKKVPPETAYSVPQAPPGGHKEGEHADFFVADEANNRYFTVSTTLRLVTPHAYMYVADGMNVDQSKLEDAAKVFEEKVYAGDREYFGPEPEVGLDGDPRVSIVNAVVPGLGGYYTSVDDYPKSIHQYSNERKALYMNIQAAPIGSAQYYAIMAHEFEHMIQWNTNREEESWVKEGSAEVATDATGLREGSSFAQSFENKPDLQLNAWSTDDSERIAHYGAAYLFISYILEHFGGYPAAADLLTGTTKGAASFDRFLAGRGLNLTFEDVFRDWVVANYLDESGTRDPKYQYSKLNVKVPSTEKITGSTGWQDRTVHQFAADYLELSGGWSSAKVRIQGDQTTRLIPARAHSGKYFWWSNRGDLVDTRLTRIFDLRKLSKATLKFWAWYDLEDGYDYAYVMASRDGGATWTTLPATTTTTDNLSGNNLGHGFTGKSGTAQPDWEEESVDLSAYTGDVVLLRFELVDDDAVNLPGFAVDDISIPDLGYSTDAESDGGWLSSGFIRTDGELPQRFLVQLIKFADQITVEQVPYSDNGATVEINNPDGKLQKAVLVVSGLTRYTTEPAHYRYSVETSP